MSVQAVGRSGLCVTISKEVRVYLQNNVRAERLRLQAALRTYSRHRSGRCGLSVASAQLFLCEGGRDWDPRGQQRAGRLRREHGLVGLVGEGGYVYNEFNSAFLDRRLYKAGRSCYIAQLSALCDSEGLRLGRAARLHSVDAVAERA